MFTFHIHKKDYKKRWYSLYLPLILMLYVLIFKKLDEWLHITMDWLVGWMLLVVKQERFLLSTKYLVVSLSLSFIFKFFFFMVLEKLYFFLLYIREDIVIFHFLLLERSCCSAHFEIEKFSYTCPWTWPKLGAPCKLLCL